MLVGMRFRNSLLQRTMPMQSCRPVHPLRRHGLVEIPVCVAQHRPSRAESREFAAVALASLERVFARLCVASTGSRVRVSGSGCREIYDMSD